MTADAAAANAIYCVRTGSHLYGTNTPTSDEDFMGVFLPDIEYALGLYTVEQVDDSFVAKGEDGKNTGEAVDFTYHELRRYVRLAMEGNPNMLETMFVDGRNIQLVHTDMLPILESFPLMVNRGMIKRFVGYANSQLHKMRVKPGNLDQLEGALGLLQGLALDPEHQKLTLLDLKYQQKSLGIHSVSFNDTYARIGDLNLQYHLKIGDAIKRIVNRLSVVSHRQDMWKAYGFDTKFGMHLIRLLMEGRELMETGRLHFPLNRADLLLDIRAGKYDMGEVEAMAERMVVEANEAEAKSSLPRGPKKREVSQVVERVLLRYLSGSPTA